MAAAIDLPGPDTFLVGEFGIQRSDNRNAWPRCIKLDGKNGHGIPQSFWPEFHVS